MDVADAEADSDICVDSVPGSDDQEPPPPDIPDHPSEKDNIRRRLQTFVDWVGLVLPLQLSIAGFVFTGPGDETRCETCGLSVSNWKKDDVPLNVHRDRSPHCTFIGKWFPTKQQNVIILDSMFNAVNAKYQAFVKFSKRLESFDVWPLKGKLQSPSNMSEAGFMYIGSADRARCFNCGLTLRDWDAEDDPFDAHLTWSSNCQYIQLLNEERKKRRGVPLSSNVNQATPTFKSSPRSVPSNSSSTFRSTSSTTSSSTATPPSTTSSRWKHSVQVETVLAMGFSEELIYEAMERRRQLKEGDFPDAISLFCAVEELACLK